MAKTKKERIPAGVRQEFDDVDYWKKLKKSKETYTLDDGTKISVYDYMKKFMQESYGNGFSRKSEESNIIKTQEQKSWAIRNNNSTNRDALAVAKKMGALFGEGYVPKDVAEEQKEEWETLIKYQGYEQAVAALVKMSSRGRNINASASKKRALIRFYIRVQKMLRYVRSDKKNEKV